MHMPDLVGRSRLAVYRTMRHDGLYFDTRGPGSSNDHWSVVTVQSPRPGVVVAWHAEATLTVRTGPGPHTTRAVPRLIGRTRRGVYAAIRSAQLYFKTVGPGSTNNSWTVALSQSPRPGARVPWHSVVVVHVSTHRVTTVVKRSPPGTTTCPDAARRGTCPRARVSRCSTSGRADRSRASSRTAKTTRAITSSISMNHSSPN
jgi:beta-lactam-binding protein with PASTA domain